MGTDFSLLESSTYVFETKWFCQKSRWKLQLLQSQIIDSRQTPEKLRTGLLRTGLHISLDVLPSWGDQDHVLQARMLWLFSCCTKRHKRECVESSGWQKDCFEPQIECFESECSKSSGWCFPSFPSFLHVLFNLLNVLPSKMAGYNNL